VLGKRGASFFKGGKGRKESPLGPKAVGTQPRHRKGKRCKKWDIAVLNFILVNKKGKGHRSKEIKNLSGATVSYA